MSAVDRIIADMNDRRGLKAEWRQIDPDIQQEIRETWGRYIREELVDRDATIQMSHIDLALAQKLAQGVRCPACEGRGDGMTPMRACTTCDGDGRLFWNGGFDAPHPVDVLLWLEEQGVIRWWRNPSQMFWADIGNHNTVSADTPEALLAAVLEALK